MKQETMKLALVPMKTIKTTQHSYFYVHKVPLKHNEQIVLVKSAPYTTRGPPTIT